MKIFGNIKQTVLAEQFAAEISVLIDLHYKSKKSARIEFNAVADEFYDTEFHLELKAKENRKNKQLIERVFNDECFLQMLNSYFEKRTYGALQIRALPETQEFVIT